MLNEQQIKNFQRDGFLVIENFASHKSCDTLLSRTGELIAEFEPVAHRSFFSTNDQEQTTDDYFLGSGDKIHFYIARDRWDLLLFAGKPVTAQPQDAAQKLYTR